MYILCILVCLCMLRWYLIYIDHKKSDRIGIGFDVYQNFGRSFKFLVPVQLSVRPDGSTDHDKYKLTL